MCMCVVGWVGHVRTHAHVFVCMVVVLYSLTHGLLICLFMNEDF